MFPDTPHPVMRRIAFWGNAMIDSTSAAMAPGTRAGQRWLSFAGALLAAGAVALSAYAAHAAAAGQANLGTAAALAFGHGVALVVLARMPHRRMAVLALVALLLGTLLFSGGLLVAHVAGVHARTAPFGGALLIAAWLAYAIDALRG
jgi:uncharacterized membrane protein YgdD (TMEM256/DUF423 family)